MIQPKTGTGTVPGNGTEPVAISHFLSNIKVVSLYVCSTLHKCVPIGYYHNNASYCSLSFLRR